MEKFNDNFGDLSGYKILSFDEVAQGFEGNKNPLQGISRKSFEEITFDKKFNEENKIYENISLEKIKKNYPIEYKKLENSIRNLETNKFKKTKQSYFLYKIKNSIFNRYYFIFIIFT